MHRWRGLPMPTLGACSSGQPHRTNQGPEVLNHRYDPPSRSDSEHGNAPDFHNCSTWPVGRDRPPHLVEPGVPSLLLSLTIITLTIAGILASSRPTSGLRLARFATHLVKLHVSRCFALCALPLHELWLLGHHDYVVKCEIAFRFQLHVFCQSLILKAYDQTVSDTFLIGKFAMMC